MFWDRYEYLCKKKGKSPNALAKEMGAGTSACTYWKNGTVPKGETLMKIAEIFDCSVDYLLGRTDNPQSHKGGVSFGDLSNNSGIVGNVGSTINGVAPLSDNATAMLEIFNTLDTVSQAELLVHANKLKKGE